MRPLTVFVEGKNMHASDDNNVSKTLIQESNKQKRKNVRENIKQLTKKKIVTSFRNRYHQINQKLINEI